MDILPGGRSRHGGRYYDGGFSSPFCCGSSVEGAHGNNKLAEDLLRQRLGKLCSGIRGAHVLSRPRQKQLPDRRALGGVFPDLDEQRRRWDPLSEASTVDHGVEGLVAEPPDAQLMAELPESNQGLVGGHVGLVRDDLVGVEEVLGQPENLLGGVGELDEVLYLVKGARLGEVLLVEFGSRAEKVLLYSKGTFFGADEDDDKDGMRIARCDISHDIRPEEETGACVQPGEWLLVLLDAVSVLASCRTGPVLWFSHCE